MPSAEDIRNQQKLLDTYRTTLGYRLNQLAAYGDADVPPVVLHDIANARREIKRIKVVLSDWGKKPEDLPGDEETPAETEARANPQRRPAGPTNNFYGPVHSGVANFGGQQQLEEAKITMGDNKGDEFNFAGANISNSNLNLKSKLDNVVQLIGAFPNADESAKKQLEQLLKLLSAELQKAPAGNEDAVEAVAETAQDLIEKAKKEKPNKSLITISAEGLKQAAANIGAVVPAILPIADQIVKHIQAMLP